MSTAVRAVEVTRILERSGYKLTTDHLTTIDQIPAALQKQSPQLIILHAATDSCNHDAILDALGQHAEKHPCLVIVDKIDRRAIEYIQAGACDCIVWDERPDLSDAVGKITNHRGSTHAPTGPLALQALRESEQKFSQVFHLSPDIVTVTRLSDGVYLDINANYTRILEYPREEVLGHASLSSDLGIWANQADRDRMLDELKTKGEVVAFESTFRTKSGQIRIGQVSAQILRYGNEDCLLCFTRDITAAKQAELALKEGEKRYRGLFEHMVEGFAYCQMVYKDGEPPDFIYLAVNPAFSELTGLRNIVGRKVSDVIPDIQTKDPKLLETYNRVARQCSHERFETYLASLDMWFSVSVYGTGDNCFVAVFDVITARKQAEAARDTTIRLLRLCNQSSDLKELARELTLFFKELTGCDAVGIRLKNGADYPYFETVGFSNAFVQAETRLCSYSPTGTPICDDGGNPLLACMCGNILQGRFDPAKPFFTQRGSFWTNSTTTLLASTTDESRQTRTRNRCHGEGYESVALIPLHSPQGTIGLLQLNDRRKGRFSLAKIGFFESLADYVTVAFEKLQSESALRTSEEHLRRALETTEAGYFFIDATGCFRKVNKAWLQMHGYNRPEEIIGQHFSVTQLEKDQSTSNEIVKKVLAGAHLASGEFTRKRKDGSTGYHTFSAHLVKEDDQVKGLEGFIIDTTSLQSIREQYSLLFDQMLDGFALHEMLFDAAGNPIDYRFIAINPAFEKMTGWRAKNVIGRTVREILPSLDPKWLKIYGEVVQTGTPARFEDFSAELNKHFEVVAFRPQERQFACLTKDVTERKQLELQLLHAQKMDAVGQLAGGVAHDFNNFLAAIMMHLNLLQHSPGLSVEIKESLTELEAEAKRAAGLTRQLLMFSRRQVIQFTTTDLNILIANLTKMLRRLIGEQISLTFASADIPILIEADTGMIEQVIMNLCVNARDAMPKGGTLKLDVTTLYLDSTESSGDTDNRSGNFACIKVVDDGCGMDEATLERIFEPFFTTKEPGRGTGLGLATVYSIVKQHHGWINVKSTPGQGTTFLVFFPTCKQEGNKHSTDQTPAEIKGGAEGILVVEDDSGFRNMVTLSLRILGYHTFDASSIKEALALWEKHSSDIGLLFTDMVLPESMNGLDLCRKLKQAKPSLRMIITTGYTNERLNPEQLSSEGIAYLAKPYTAETLANAVRQCIDTVPV